MPGAGKTILASIIIEDLMELAKSNKRICVAFAFSRYTDALTVEEILAGLLRQILEDHPQTIVYIQHMHDHHSLRKTRPSKQELVGVLEKIFTSNLFDERFCSLDGLDEAKSVTQFELLDTLSQLPVNLLITSRPLHLLEGNVPTADHFSIIVQDSDIERLIEEKVFQIPTLEGLLANDEFKAWVVKAIIEKSSGMFLVASLQLDMLAVCVNVHGLRKAVETLPIGVEAMYQTTMVRVETHDQAAMAKRALTWLVHALESLKMDDLRYAIAVDPDTFKFDPELLIDGPTILSLCCGLVTLEPESELVRLVHYTAKDFLEPYLKREDPDPHAMLASTCAARLVQFNLNNRQADTQANYSQRQHSHLSVALPASTRDLILHCSSHPICGKYGRFVCTGSWIHVAAAYNFHELLEEWFHPSCHPADGSQSQLLPPSPPDLDINAQAFDGSTALILAADFSHAETVRVLLNVEGIDVAFGDRDGWTALMFSAANGSLEIVEMLLAVVDMNHASSRDVFGNTALKLASHNGHVEVVRALVRFQSTTIKNLSKGASSEEASFISECGEALVEAAQCGYQGIVETLLGVKGINVNYVPNGGRKALMCASVHGHKSTVEMLLQHEDIFIDYALPNGRTALAFALKEAKHDIAELLRSHGAQEPSADIYKNFIHNDSIKRWD
ncbi:ankyrin [Coprinopsis marcescibilis]|uniref:Ankyrin n=1 Tax=Coprinopsis marcescibilis TaxID=230819 RepID=A0A5C3K9L5_COPMA|nr:ankyrin [Coprinopsis marcescibilis]